MNSIQKDRNGHDWSGLLLFILISLVLVASVILFGCSTAEEIAHESRVNITLKYIGEFQSYEPVQAGRIGKKTFTRITTTQHEFYLYGEPALDIQPGARCYVKYFPQKIPNSISSLMVLYFTYDGCDDFYELWQNQYTGEIY